MERKDKTIYIPIKILAMIGNLRKELPTIEKKLVDEYGRFNVREADLAGKASIVFDRDRNPYLILAILAEQKIEDAREYLRALCNNGLIVPDENKDLKSFGSAETLGDLTQRLGY